PTSTEGTAGLPNFQAELLQRVNAARAAGTTCGGTAYPAAPALRWETRLQAAALGHSQDMATNNYFSHTSRDGRTFDQRIRAQGYTFSGASENIAMGQTSVAQVMASWLGSTGHCVNIMSASSQDIGVAAVRGTNGSLYWTMKIAAPAR
ncbi:MAG: CAP domain-containing protein, partial [Pseudomonadota bacterium]